MKQRTMEKKKTQKRTAKGVEKALISIADVFAGLPCTGPWYEVKVPKKLQKQFLVSGGGEAVGFTTSQKYRLPA